MKLLFAAGKFQGFQRGFNDKVFELSAAIFYAFDWFVLSRFLHDFLQLMLMCFVSKVAVS